MKDDDDKKIIQELRNIVGVIDKNLYRTQSNFQEAIHFPNINYVSKLQKYIGMSKKSIDLLIFSFTNDQLENKIITTHKRGVTVRIITDDEAIKGIRADAQRCADIKSHQEPLLLFTRKS